MYKRNLKLLLYQYRHTCMRGGGVCIRMWKVEIRGYKIVEGGNLQVKLCGRWKLGGPDRSLMHVEEPSNILYYATRCRGWGGGGGNVNQLIP